MTAGALFLTAYLALYGLISALDPAAHFKDRVVAAVFFLPFPAMVLCVIGLLPPVRGRPLFWLGVVAGILLLCTAAACIFLGLPAAFFSLLVAGYGTLWWHLVNGKLAPKARATTSS